MNQKTINIIMAVLCFIPVILMVFATFRTGEIPDMEMTVETPMPIMEWFYKFGTYFEIVTENNGTYIMPTGYYYSVQAIMTCAAVELVECIPAIILWIPRRVKEIFE